jgi:hypothetical protein
MANEATYSGILGGAQRFHTSLETSVREIPHLEAGRLRLGDSLDRVQGLFTQQATLTAAKQDVSQEIKTTMEDIQFLMTILRKAVRQHFGKKSEKLAEFGVQPFRGRKVKAGGKPFPPPETIPAPADR